MSAIAPVLIKERMTHEEFMDWCDEDTKADLIEGVIFVQTRNYLQDKASCLPSSLLSIPRLRV